jgi:hypothetical protein
LTGASLTANAARQLMTAIAIARMRLFPDLESMSACLAVGLPVRLLT